MHNARDILEVSAMDKLRAIQYFNQAAESGSFAAAARTMNVSAPAIVQLVGALERSLGRALFHRTTQGLTLTADGERYYEVSRQIVADLRDVEQRLGPRGAPPRGTLTIGMRPSVGMHCVLPRIARFIASNPDIEIVIRPSFTVQDIDDKHLDLALLVGWPPERDLVVRQLVQTRLIVCASPDYWSRKGVPREPDDLREHDCLILRSSGGTLLDRWIFERNGEQRTIDVKTRMVGDDLAWLGEAAAAGAGVLRVIDITLPGFFSTARLAPALPDWEALEAPVVYAAYPRIQRRSRLVRVFLDFLVEVFADVESQRPSVLGAAIPRVPKPEWFGRTHGRQSAFATRRRKRTG
jgi:LysR family transcriptional regulator, regulator for bpeEF and oprC